MKKKVYSQKESELEKNSPCAPSNRALSCSALPDSGKLAIGLAAFQMGSLPHMVHVKASLTHGRD